MGGESRTKLSRIVGRVDRLLRPLAREPMAVHFLSRRLLPATLVRGRARRVRGARPARHHRHRRGPGRRKRRRAHPRRSGRRGRRRGRPGRGRGRGRRAGSFDGGPVVDCVSCVGQSCGSQLLTCVISTTCRTALQCVVTTCLSGGAPDLTCVETCTNGRRDGADGSRRHLHVHPPELRIELHQRPRRSRWGWRRRRSRGWRRRGLRGAASDRCWGQCSASPSVALPARRGPRRRVAARGPAALRRRREGRGREPLGGRARQAAARLAGEAHRGRALPRRALRGAPRAAGGGARRVHVGRRPGA